MQRYTIVASNVPGPAEPVYVCGQKVLGLQVFCALPTSCLVRNYGHSHLRWSHFPWSYLLMAALTMAGLLPQPDHADALRVVRQHHARQLLRRPGNPNPNPNPTPKPQPQPHPQPQPQTPYQDVVVGHAALPTLYIDELRALALHFGVDPDDPSAAAPVSGRPAAAVAVASAAAAPSSLPGSGGSALAMV
jgi:hypothetical protein